MNQIDQIVEEYKSSDFEKRLNLFLECPSLRTRFLEIDLNSEDDAASAKKTLKKGFRRLHTLHLLLFHNY